MVTFAQAVQKTPAVSYTANGMVTLAHSGDPTVDLFFSIASSRGKDVTAAFARSYAADPDLTMKMLFWARDARHGSGERNTFRNIIRHLEKTQPDSLLKNLKLVSEYGRWDDLLVFETPLFKLAAFDLFTRALRDGNGLAAKWTPVKGPIANELRKYLNMTPKAFRQMVVGIRNTVEQKMCAQEWSDINYNHVPSVAANRYMKAFTKRDKDRYAEWKAGLKTGVTKVNAAVLYPYDVLKSVTHGVSDVALAQWNALPNYLNSDSRILPVIDTSSSMNQPVGGQEGVGMDCMHVAISLGLYIADKQTGAFKDCFLNFNDDSHIHVIHGDLLAKLTQIRRCSWGGSTNIESAFRSILDVAIKNQLPAEEMPKYLVVLSDMEYNPAYHNGRSVGAFELGQKMFSDAGYTCPRIVWWNLSARTNATGNVPVMFDQNGTALVSGFGASILKSILGAKNFTPRDIMLETLMSERYAAVTA